MGEKTPTGKKQVLEEELVKPVEETPVEKPKEDETPEDETPEKKPEEKTPEEKKPTDKKPADKKLEEKKPEEKKPADKKPADKKPEEKKPEEKKPEEKKPEEKKPADKKPGEIKPKDKEPEDEKPDDVKPEETTGVLLIDDVVVKVQEAFSKRPTSASGAFKVEYVTPEDEKLELNIVSRKLKNKPEEEVAILIKEQVEKQMVDKGIDITRTVEVPEDKMPEKKEPVAQKTTE